MFKKFLKKIRRDKADSVVSLVMLLPLFISLAITIFDASIYFADRSVVQNIAQTGARTVAIMGGDGDATKATPLENAYGQDRDTVCNSVASDGRSAKAKTDNSSTTECNVMYGLQESSSLISVDINSVKCTPTKTDAIGTRTSCEVKWKYKGIPGSALSLLKLGNESVNAGSSESEVDMTEVPLVPRTGV